MNPLRLVTTLFLTFLFVLLACAEDPLASGANTIGQRVESILARMSLEEKIDLVGGDEGMFIRGYPELGWPRLRMADGPMGIRGSRPSTAYPAGIGLAATWDADLAKRIGASIGRDARARGVHFLLGPGVNIYRAPMCGRNFEYFGEDPYLGARIAVNYINGVQSQGVVAVIKHFMGNNSEFDRHVVNCQIDERTEREIYLPIFEAAVKEAQVGAVMNSYNLVNGQQMTQNSLLNCDVLKTEWGFRGILMSDWDATCDGIAAANGGLDLEMPAGKFMNRQTLLPAISTGNVALSTIEDKVRRIVRTALEFGLLDREQKDLRIPHYDEEARALAVASAEKSFVLLKNEGAVLPLEKRSIKTLAVIGPTAYPAQPVGGGAAAVEPYNSVSYFEGLSDYLRGTNVLYCPGLVPPEEIFSKTIYSVDAAGKQPGLRGEYFANAGFSGKPTVQVDPHVNYRWQGWGVQSALVSSLSVRWSGYFTPKKSGPFLWLMNGPGLGSGKLYIDDKQVASRTFKEAPTPTWLSLTLEAGKAYSVRFECVFNWAWRSQTIGVGAIAVEDIVTLEAKEMASMADAAVVCVGYSQDSEAEGVDRSFELGIGQDELVKAVRAANAKTIAILTAGGSADVSQWIGTVPAFLLGWYPGQEGGRALPRVLFGDIDPSGRLPISFERLWADNPVRDSYYVNAPGSTVIYKEGVFVGYRGYEHNRVTPLFPFGFGLSYTTFKFSSLSVQPAAPKLGQTTNVSLDVTNTGRRAGTTVVQLYLGHPTASVPRPFKELKGFLRVDLMPGETRRVTLPLDARAMSYWDSPTHAWKQESGRYTVFAGQSSAHIEQQAGYEVMP